MGSEVGGVFGAGTADGDGGDGDAARHLDGGEERIHALEGTGVDGDADDGFAGEPGDGPGQVRGKTGGGDEDGAAPGVGLVDVVMGGLGGAVGGGDFEFEWDAQFGEDVLGSLQFGQVGVGAHEDGDEGFPVAHFLVFLVLVVDLVVAFLRVRAGFALARSSSASARVMAAGSLSLGVRAFLAPSVT